MDSTESTGRDADISPVFMRDYTIHNQTELASIRGHCASRFDLFIVESLESRLLFDATIGIPNVVNISRMPGDQTEPTIVVDPANSQEMFAASNNGGASLMGAVSSDGGTTWSKRLVALGSDGLPLAKGDPSAAFDTFGNLFLTYVGEDSNQAELLLSTDGGATFSHVASLGANAAQPTVATGHASVWVAFEQNAALMVTPSDIAENKAVAKAVPKIPVVAKAGAVAYWAAVVGPGNVGQFRKPAVLATGAGQNIGDIAVGPGGQVVVAYQTHTAAAPSTIYVRRDSDGVGKKPIGAPILVGTTNVTDAESIPAQPHRAIDAEVGLAYDMSGDAYAGRLYMVYTDQVVAAGSDTDIALRYSDDDGITWSAPARVNDDSTASSQFLPRVAVDSTTGAVAVTWYDARNDTGVPPAGDDSVSNNDVQIYAAIGTPTATGVSFLPNFQVSAGFSNTSVAANANDFGGYAGLAFYNGVLAPAWADNSNSTSGNPDGSDAGLDVYTAQIAVQITPTPIRSLVGQFGDLGGKLLVTTGNSGAAYLSLTHGTGTAFINGDSLELTINGTGAWSALLIKPISGVISLGDVTVSGPLKSVIAKTADLGGTLFVNGSLGSATLGSVTGGTVAVTADLRTFVAASLADARLLVGTNYGSDAQPGGVGTAADVFGPGAFGAIKIAGAVNDSIIAAGVNPIDGNYGNADDIVPDSFADTIRTIVVRGGVSDSTIFEAGKFFIAKIPKRIDPLADARFHILVTEAPS